MKNIILVTILFSSIFISCEPRTKTIKNGDDKIIIQVDSTKYRVEKIYFGNLNGYIYLLIPDSSTVQILPQSIGYRQGKTTTTIIKVK